MAGEVFAGDHFADSDCFGSATPIAQRRSSPSFAAIPMISGRSAIGAGSTGYPNDGAACIKTHIAVATISRQD
jgi:hypothetical protein